VELAGGISVAIIIAAGSDQVEAGDLFLFIELMRRFFMPLRDLSAKFSVMQSAMASSERIFQLMDTEPGIVDPPEPVTSKAYGSEKRGVVEFDHVSFAYQGEDWVLRDISFRVEAGEKVAFVGATGAGKSSIIKLLTRLYDIDQGSITLDGVDLRKLAQRDLRQRVSMVLQDVFLFRGTIADNIGLGRPGVDEEKIRRAARMVEAHRFIERLPQGYDTPMQERGSNLSSGQQQLLSFARTLAQDFDVLLLDEATSSIDTETEALVQKGIHLLMEGKTAIVIAHRLSTIEDVDRIYVMERGKIVESGRHAELLASGGVYSRLHALQYTGSGSKGGATLEK
jgi:ATP-binding cassette subfamily B multidrug efflux pump